MPDHPRVQLLIPNVSYNLCKPCSEDRRLSASGLVCWKWRGFRYRLGRLGLVKKASRRTHWK